MVHEKGSKKKVDSGILAKAVKGGDIWLQGSKEAYNVKNFSAILAKDPIYQGLLAAAEAMPASRPAPVTYQGPTYVTGTPVRVSQRNRAALQSMVARTLADGRREIITAAIARIEANRAAHERGCTPAHCRGLNLFDYVEALAALREAA
jgi:hypothetical protein